MKKTFTFYFSGTGFPISAQFHQAAFFNRYTKSNALDHYVRGYSGCGVDYGTMGVIFGSGLDKQTKNAVAFIKVHLKPGDTAVVNVYGHSRGAIAALLLAKRLGKIPKSQLLVNLMLHDPVPGNLILTGQLDALSVSLANKVRDLSACHNLEHVHYDFPHIPLPDLACHAPLIAKHALETKVSKLAVGGCHANAASMTMSVSHADFSPAQFVSFVHSYRFLRAHGTNFELPEIRLSGEVVALDESSLNVALKKAYSALIESEGGKQFRSMHSAGGLIIQTKPGQKYFNREHQRLNNIAVDDKSVTTFFADPNSLQAHVSRLNYRHPMLTSIAFWLSIGMLGAVILTSVQLLIPMMTGIGLSTIPFVGAFALVSIAGALTAFALTSLCQIALKPLVSKVVYPAFNIEDPSQFSSVLNENNASELQP